MLLKCNRKNCFPNQKPWWRMSFHMEILCFHFYCRVSANAYGLSHTEEACYAGVGTPPRRLGWRSPDGGLGLSPYKAVRCAGPAGSPTAGVWRDLGPRGYWACRAGGTARSWVKVGTAHCGQVGILARRGMFASFSGPLLHNHNHVAHA